MTDREASKSMALASTLLILLVPSFSGPSSGMPTPGAMAAHDPIFIDGNGAFTAGNGVTGGQGTALDPYVIEGLEINASQAVGLVIQNTDAHLRVRNVVVRGGGLSQVGIRLYNVKNVSFEGVRSVENREGLEASGVEDGLSIRDSYFEDNGIGILLWGTMGIVVRNNVFVNDGIAFIGNMPAHYASHDIAGNLVNGKPLVYYTHCADVDIVGANLGQLIVADCARVTISQLEISVADVGIVLAFTNRLSLRRNNVTGIPRVSGTDTGISAHFVTNTTIEENVIADNDYGLSFDGGNFEVSVRGNEFRGNTRGVFGWLSDFRIGDNKLTSNSGGLELMGTTNGLVRGNMAIDNQVGISLQGGHNLTVAGNRARGNGHGVSVLLGANITIMENNLSSGRGYGVIATHSENLTVAGNQVADNFYGIYLAGTRESYVFQNNLVGNQIQAGDTGDGNHWDAGYPAGGNYWSNYSGVDRCSGPSQDVCPYPDGIGDVPFPLAGQTKDRYPLMEPRPLFGGDAPLITHSAPSVIQPGQAAAIDVFVVGLGGIDRVELHYKESGLDEEATVMAPRIGNDHYRGWLAPLNREGNLEYYVKVYLVGGNVTVYPASGRLHLMVERSSESLPLVVPAVLGSAGAVASAMIFLVLRRKRRGRSSDPQIEDRR